MRICTDNQIVEIQSQMGHELAQDGTESRMACLHQHVPQIPVSHAHLMLVHINWRVIFFTIMVTN